MDSIISSLKTDQLFELSSPESKSKFILGLQEIERENYEEAIKGKTYPRGGTNAALTFAARCL